MLDEAAAHHEAGHLLGFWLAGIEIISSTIAPSNGNTGLTVTGKGLFRPGDALTVEGFRAAAGTARALLCGPLAEEHHTGLDPWGAAEVDLGRVWAIARVVAGGDDAAMNTWFEERRRAAARLVAEHWPVITRVAGVLLAEGTLNGARVARLLRYLPRDRL